MHVCVCVLALTHGEGMCVSSQRPPLSVCVRMYMNELVALQQFPGSEGAAFSEQHCMFTVLTHIHSKTYINLLTYPERPLRVETQFVLSKNTQPFCAICFFVLSS